MPHIFPLTGIVIDKRDFREKDVIFTLLTTDNITVDILAKYAKKVPSKHNSGLELFNGVECLMYQGKLFPVVDQSIQFLSFTNIWKTYENMMHAFEIAKFIKDFVALGQFVPSLYTFVQKTFFLLHSLDKEYHPLLLISFKIKLMCILGFLSFPEYCNECEKQFQNQVFFDRQRYMCEKCCFRKSQSLVIPYKQYELFRSIRNSAFEDILVSVSLFESLSGIHGSLESMIEHYR